MSPESTKARFTLLPALDIRGGAAVRLTHGSLKSESQHGDPLEVAQELQRAGAEWVHLVDLDAAFGTGSNRELLSKVIEILDLKVQLSGGIKDQESLTTALATGCERVNLSTTALTDLTWVRDVVAEHGERITVALDVRDRKLAPRGSGQEVGDLFEAIETLEAAGCRRYVVTDVNRDGALSGPNIELLTEICELTSRPVIASGGVARLADLSALRELMDFGLEGAIVGKALYSGDLRLADALEVCAG